MNKIKCFVKRPGAPPYSTWISDSLENLQRFVEGPIEFVPVGHGWGIICNEEGKLQRLQPNIWIHDGFDYIAGTAVFVGVQGENFCDMPVDFQTFKRACMPLFPDMVGGPKL